MGTAKEKIKADLWVGRIINLRVFFSDEARLWALARVEGHKDWGVEFDIIEKCHWTGVRVHRTYEDIDLEYWEPTDAYLLAHRLRGGKL